jgi:hypothetical protein
VTPLNGFLAGVLLPFDPARATTLDASYRIDIDDRRFEVAVRNGQLTGARGEPAVTVRAAAADLVTARFGSTAAERKSALQRVAFEGEADAVEGLRDALHLVADPGAFAAV